ncbi:MAG: hypothetical protein NW218_22040 [Saprospiraceae bacterium]|nr:hypothetical protein [Saprospiraceae bacterium]
MEETEKTFDPDLRVVDANPTLRNALFHFGGMGCLGVVMGFLLYLAFVWLMETLGEKYSWLAKIGAFFLILLCLMLFLGTALTMLDSFRHIRFSNQLRKNGVLTKGTVVGREKVDQSENDVFYVFYQFRPDFVMRLQDNSNNLQFYKLPVGSEIKVCYLADSPEVSTLIKEAKTSN